MTDSDADIRTSALAVVRAQLDSRTDDVEFLIESSDTPGLARALAGLWCETAESLCKHSHDQNVRQHPHEATAWLIQRLQRGATEQAMGE